MLIDQSECFLGWGHCREQAVRSPGPSGNFQPHTHPSAYGGAEGDGKEEDGAKVLRTRQKKGGKEKSWETSES